MRNVYKFLCFVLAFSLCCFSVLADDIPADQSAPDLESGIESSGQEGGGDGELDDPSDIGLSESDGSIDSLYVTNLIVEGEEETEDFESYSIVDDVQYGSYFHADISDFGEVYIYIPVAYSVDSFSYNAAGLPINITGSSITGYIAGENSNQAIQFPSFGVPRYRVNNYNDYEYISRWEEIDSSVIVYSNEDNFSSYSSEYYLRLIFMVCAADLVLNFFIRLLGGLKS